eukprot:TRINITY_DN5775_c2_g1_i1.p1 TRINITY_DN5775_c2_g1~~TRINITY_DN5775_c2_g1_i1.p1  ORF type:complete len:1119 (+),score=219.65 TRINITY_DN5775_c2_g1_i1:69-3425(+)
MTTQMSDSLRSDGTDAEGSPRRTKSQAAFSRSGKTPTRPAADGDFGEARKQSDFFGGSIATAARDEQASAVLVAPPTVGKRIRIRRSAVPLDETPLADASLSRSRRSGDEAACSTQLSDEAARSARLSGDEAARSARLSQSRRSADDAGLQAEPRSPLQSDDEMRRLSSSNVKSAASTSTVRQGVDPDNPDGDALAKSTGATTNLCPGHADASDADQCWGEEEEWTEYFSTGFGPARLAAFAIYPRDPGCMRSVIARAAESFQMFDIEATGSVTTDEVGAALHALGCTKNIDVRQSFGQVLAGEGDEAQSVSLVSFLTFVVMNMEMLGVAPKKGWAKLLDKRRELLDKRQQLNFSAAQLERVGRMTSTNKKLKLWLPDSQWRKHWDLMMLCVIAASFLIVTTEVTFSLRPTGPVLVCTVVMHCLFVADVGIFVNTCQRTKSGRLITARAGVLVNNWKLLVAEMLSGMPFDYIALAAGVSTGVYSALRSLRVLKLVKIPYLVQRSGRLPMDAQYVVFFFRTLPLLRYALWVVVALNSTVVIKLMLSDDRPGKSSPNEIAEEWAAELFWVFTLLTTAPALLEVDNVWEKVFAGALMAGAVMVQGIIVGQMSVLVLKESVQLQTADIMRQTFEILEHYEIPVELQKEILSFQHHSLRQSAHTFAAQLQNLPESIQKEIEIYVKMETVSAVKMFKKTSLLCRVRLVSALQTCVSAPDHCIITAGETGREMFFLVHGFADVILTEPAGLIVATLSGGDAFGEVALLTDCKRTAHVRALTYCDLLVLPKDEFLCILQEFGDFRAIVLMEMKERGLSNEKSKPGACSQQQVSEAAEHAEQQSVEGLAKTAPYARREGHRLSITSGSTTPKNSTPGLRARSSLCSGQQAGSGGKPPLPPLPPVPPIQPLPPPPPPRPQERRMVEPLRVDSQLPLLPTVQALAAVFYKVRTLRLSAGRHFDDLKRASEILLQKHQKIQQEGIDIDVPRMRRPTAQNLVAGLQPVQLSALGGGSGIMSPTTTRGFFGNRTPSRTRNDLQALAGRVKRNSRWFSANAGAAPGQAPEEQPAREATGTTQQTGPTSPSTEGPVSPHALMTRRSVNSVSTAGGLKRWNSVRLGIGLRKRVQS